MQKMIDCFRKLPGVGSKSAVRMAFGVLNMSEEEAGEFCRAVMSMKNDVTHCEICQNLSDSPVCSICSDDRRDRTTVCVVEDARAVMAIEKTRDYKGLYHVLGGVISPLNGIGPEDLSIKELIARMGSGEVKEVIMATNPDTEGEATAMYISRLLRPMEIKVTRLAYGVPVGSQLEYADEVTLSRALEGRQEI